MIYFDNVERCARLQNRFELAALITKLVLTIVTVFMMGNSHAFAAVSFSASLFLMVSSIVMLPFYNNYLNMAVCSPSLLFLLPPLFFPSSHVTHAAEVRLVRRDLLGERVDADCPQVERRLQLDHNRCWRGWRSLCYWCWRFCCMYAKEGGCEGVRE